MDSKIKQLISYYPDQTKFMSDVYVLNTYYKFSKTGIPLRYSDELGYYFNPVSASQVGIGHYQKYLK